MEYFYDDPADDTDSADIPKVGYARRFTGERVRADGSVLPVDFIIGSGFYGRASDEVTAADVKDAETLKAFVEGAAAWSATFYRSQRLRPLCCRHQCRGRLETREHLPHSHVAERHGNHSYR